MKSERERQIPYDIIYLFIHLFIYLLCLFAFHRAAPAAYGGSQAGGLIGAVAAAYARATAKPDTSLVCTLRHRSWQRQILNLLSEARDQTRNLMVPSRIR